MKKQNINYLGKLTISCIKKISCIIGPNKFRSVTYYCLIGLKLHLLINAIKCIHFNKPAPLKIY